MHRVICGLVKGDGKFSDHINGDGLNCRRSNLRVTTKQGNNQNQQRLQRNNRSGYRGVCWITARQRWGAYAYHNRRRCFAGHFDTVTEAARAAAALRKQLGFLDGAESKPTAAQEVA